MDVTPPSKKEWTLTQESFDKLLLHLNTDREIAARRYEEIRRRLITFFECRGVLSPEDYCDLTINRVTKRIGDGVEIHTSDVVRFFFGVARKILQESRQDYSTRNIPLDDSINVDSLPGPSWEAEAQEKRLAH